MTIYVVLNSRLGFKEKIVFIVYGDYKNSVHTVEVENIALKKKWFRRQRSYTSALSSLSQKLVLHVITLS